MSDFEKGAVAPVEPLTLTSTNGELCTRPDYVETQLGRLNALTASQRAEALPEMHPESIVHLIAHGGRADEMFYGPALQIIAGKVDQHVELQLSRVKKAVVAEISGSVRVWVLERLLTVPPDPCVEFFEISFARAVHARTLKEYRSYRRSIMGGKRGCLPTDEAGGEGDEVDRPLEFVPDTAPGPEAIAVGNSHKREQHRVFRNVCGRIKDRTQLNILKLHFGHGVPIVSSDPDVEDLVSRTGLGTDRVKYLLRSGLKIMRRALLGAKGGNE